MDDDIKVIDPKKKKTYKCPKCSKTFTLKAKYSSRCPYCGCYDLMDYSKANDAQNLIDEVSQGLSDKQEQ